jgi:Lar family restriction alleviation protein
MKNIRKRQSGRPLKPCPFCSSSDKQPGFKSPLTDGGWLLIECLNCGTTGPIRKTIKQAEAAWNRRIEPKAKRSPAPLVTRRAGDR